MRYLNNHIKKVYENLDVGHYLCDFQMFKVYKMLLYQITLSKKCNKRKRLSQNLLFVINYHVLSTIQNIRTEMVHKPFLFMNLFIVEMA